MERWEEASRPTAPPAAASNKLSATPAAARRKREAKEMTWAVPWQGLEPPMRRAAAAAAAAAARHHSLCWLDLSSYYPRRRDAAHHDVQGEDNGAALEQQLSSFEARLLQLCRREASASSRSPLPLPALSPRSPRRVSSLGPQHGQADATGEPPPPPVDIVTLDTMPHGVRRAFSSRGIIALWDWQTTLLASVPVVRDHRNALVCLPSGSGKSVAADLLLLRTVLKERRSALLALPYQSAVHEKVQAFEAMVLSTDLWVESHDGSSPSPQLSTRPALYVCTYEKATVLITQAILQGRQDDVGLVVVDELQMIGEAGGDSVRGALLETMIMKLLNFCPQTHLVAFSGLLCNPALVAKTMRALTFEFDFRPIPLSLFIRSGALLQNAARTFSRQICRDDIIGMAQLCVEIMPSSTLLFCPSRLQACKYASQLGAAITNEVRELDARYVFKPQVFPKNKVLLHNPASLVRDCVAPLASSSLFSLRLSLIADLAACGVALTSAARAAIAAGVCFHHGGMGPDARRIVEAALRERVICVLCCTTALAAGVNFPARRVIIAAPIVGHEQLSHEKFTQICGRAGRYGHDSVGEAVLFCSAETEALGWQLVAGGNRTVATSVLRMGMDRFLLEMVCCAARAGGVTAKGTRPKDVAFSELQSLTRLSLHAQCLVDAHASDTTAATAALAELDNAVVEQLQKLQADGFVVIDDERRCVWPTAEGSAVFVSFISLAAAERLRRDVSVAGLSSGFNEVQLMHMLVPPIAAMLPRFDWLAIHDHVWPTLDKNMVIAAASLHVEERCLYLLAYTKGASVAAEDELRMRRFICACMLIEFMANFDVAAVAAHFRVEIGAVHALQEASCAHAVCISDFMGTCGMWCVQSMCLSAVQRMRSGGESEMHSLVQIRCCNAQRARALLGAGIKSPAHVATAGQSKVLEALVRNCGAQPQGIAAAIVQHAAFLIGQEVKMLQSRAKDLLRVKVS